MAGGVVCGLGLFCVSVSRQNKIDNERKGVVDLVAAPHLFISIYIHLSIYLSIYLSKYSKIDARERA